MALGVILALGVLAHGSLFRGSANGSSLPVLGALTLSLSSYRRQSRARLGLLTSISLEWLTLYTNTTKRRGCDGRAAGRRAVAAKADPPLPDTPNPEAPCPISSQRGLRLRPPPTPDPGRPEQPLCGAVAGRLVGENWDWRSL